MPATDSNEQGNGTPSRAVTHLALYRAWRPTRFADVVGQEHVTRTLRNALVAGRVAHAYLLCGPRGTGKTSVAKILARAVNCQAPEAGEPCDRCDACQAILSGRALDVLEIDAASHRGIEEIRDLREKVKYSPAALRQKVYIIDEVHMLTPEAFNALLRTLEEPPAHVIFVLATTDPHKVPATILSRCQRFDFHRLTQEEIAGRLRQVCHSLGARAGDDVLREIARYAEGGLRDALSLLDQCLAFAGGEVSADHLCQLLGVAGRDELVAVARGLVEGDAVAVLAAVDRVHQQGRDLRQFVRDLMGFFRDVLFVQTTSGAAELHGVTAGAADDDFVALAGGVPSTRIVGLLQSLSRLDGDMRWATQSRLCLEIGLLGILVDEGAAPPRAAAPAPARAAAPAPARAAAPAPPPDRPSQAGEVQRPETGGAPADPPPGAPHLAQVQAAWPAIRERVKKQRRPLYALLDPARPVAIEGRDLVLSFGREFGFHRDRVGEPANREYLKQVVREVLGYELTIRCTSASAPPPGADGAGGAGAGSDTAIEALLNEFGGQVVDLDIEAQEA